MFAATRQESHSRAVLVNHLNLKEIRTELSLEAGDVLNRVSSLLRSSTEGRRGEIRHFVVRSTRIIAVSTGGADLAIILGVTKWMGITPHLYLLLSFPSYLICIQAMSSVKRLSD